MKTLLGILIILNVPIGAVAQESSYQGIQSAQQLIETIIEETGAAEVSNTVDVIKAGSGETKVRGIVTCMFATMEVLKKAVEMDCNLIVTHEPLYYNHLDSPEAFKNDEVFLAKKKYINDNGLVVWRFHDYIHRIRPDGIISGMEEKLGWGERKKAGTPNIFTFPGISLIDLLRDLKKTFPKNGFQVVGSPELVVSQVALVPGASGTMAHITQFRKPGIDVVIAGEVPQWETYEYVRDAMAQGREKALVLIGHINSEENGMKFCADWLKGFISDVPIHFVECGSSYWTY